MSLTLAGKLLSRGRANRYATLSRAATLWRLGVIVVALGLWELLAAIGVLNELFVSRPSAIMQAAISLASTQQAVNAVSETLTSVGVAFVIGTTAGILAGVVFGLQAMLREAYFPIVMMLMGIPKSVFLPVFILFFGLGATSAIAFGALLAFVHVTINAVAGVDLVEDKHHRVASAFCATWWRRFIHVIVPGASPGLFTALWHGLRNAFVGVVVAELFISTVGIGAQVRIYSNNFQTAEVLALVLTVSVGVILIGTAWNRVEARLTRWRGKEAV